MIGDGFCDDETNNQGCNFDGGDCCGSCIVKSHCSDCLCLQPDVDEHNITNALVGDGYCNDDTNNPDCNFDGGDCCGGNVNMQYCTDCQCHRSSSSHVITIPESTNLLIFFTKFSLFCFSIEIKNADITVYHNRKRHIAAL